MADIEKEGNWGEFNMTFSNQGLNEKAIRIGFIRKVYLIVSSQLIFTFGICSIFVLVDSVKEFAKSDTGFYLYIAS